MNTFNYPQKCSRSLNQSQTKNNYIKKKWDYFVVYLSSLSYLINDSIFLPFTCTVFTLITLSMPGLHQCKKHKLKNKRIPTSHLNNTMSSK